MILSSFTVYKKPHKNVDVRVKIWYSTLWRILGLYSTLLTIRVLSYVGMSRAYNQGGILVASGHTF